MWAPKYVSGYMCMFVCACVCIYIYTHTNIYIYIYIHIHINAYMYVCIYMHHARNIRSNTYYSWGSLCVWDFLLLLIFRAWCMYMCEKIPTNFLQGIWPRTPKSNKTASHWDVPNCWGEKKRTPKRCVLLLFGGNEKGVQSYEQKSSNKRTPKSNKTASLWDPFGMSPLMKKYQ